MAIDIGRRKFITALGTAAAWPLAARAQQLRRVGILMNGDTSEKQRQSYLESFLQGLHNLGWIEAQNLHIELRWSGGDEERSRIAANELLQLSPDVIFSSSTRNLSALLKLGPTMPIVFIQVSDPVTQGFVSNLAHPGGNITGFTAFEISMGGKWVDLLKQMAPSLKRVALVFNPEVSPQSKYFLASVEAAATSFGVEAAAAHLQDEAGIESVIETLSRQPNTGLIFPPDSFVQMRSKVIVAIVARHRLPAIYVEGDYMEYGGLMSYDQNFNEQFRQAASYVDRILKGAKPGDLPIQLPTKFKLVINLTAAKALGLTVPPTLLALADEVIE
jgi:putative tryptophan/tyrosine transport system substrate-binding protein